MEHYKVIVKNSWRLSESKNDMDKLFDDIVQIQVHQFLKDTCRVEGVLV